MSALKKVGDKIFGKKKVIEHYPLSPEDIKRDEQIRALQQAIQSRDAQIGQLIAEERKKKESVIKEDKEQKLIGRLEEQTKQIKKEQFGDSISLLKFAYSILNGRKPPENIEDAKSPWGRSIDLTGKDCTKPFCKFGDLLFFDNGYIGITDPYGNVMSFGKKLSSVFYNPNNLGSQLAKNFIEIPRDKDGNRVIDIDELEAPNYYQIGDGEYEMTNEAYDKVKEMMMKKDELIRQSSQQAEVSQRTMLDVIEENKRLKRTNSVLQNNLRVKEMTTSEAIQKSLSFNSAVNELQNRIMHETEARIRAESVMSAYETANKVLLEKIEQVSGKSSREIIEEEIQTRIEWSKNNIAENTIVKEEVVRPEPSKSQPGRELS